MLYIPPPLKYKEVIMAPPILLQAEVHMPSKESDWVMCEYAKWVHVVKWPFDMIILKYTTDQPTQSSISFVV